MSKSPITIESLRHLDEHRFEYRFSKRQPGKPSAPKPPVLRALADFVATHFAGKVIVDTRDWSETAYRKHGRVITWTGKERKGLRLEVFVAERAPSGVLVRGEQLLDFRSTASYATNWDVVSEIVQWDRRFNPEVYATSEASTSDEPDVADPDELAPGF